MRHSDNQSEYGTAHSIAAAAFEKMQAKYADEKYVEDFISGKTMPYLSKEKRAEHIAALREHYAGALARAEAIAALCKSPRAKIAAMLNRVMLYANVRESDLKAAGIGSDIINALWHLCRSCADEERYFEGIALCPVATEVKFAELDYKIAQCKGDENAAQAFAAQKELLKQKSERLNRYSPL